MTYTCVHTYLYYTKWSESVFKISSGYMIPILPALYHTLASLCSLAVVTDSTRETFSMFVVSFAQEAQGMLESPLQIVFAMTLMVLGIVPTPFEEDKVCFRQSCCIYIQYIT